MSVVADEEDTNVVTDTSDAVGAVSQDSPSQPKEEASEVKKSEVESTEIEKPSTDSANQAQVQVPDMNLLPESLHEQARGLEAALTGGGDVQAAYVVFADVAFRSEETVNPAAMWLVKRFTGSTTELANLARHSDLTAELMHRSNALTHAVAIAWDSASQLHRLVRLGENLLANQVRLQHNEAATFEASLAASLAFNRPKIARQLIDAAEPLLTESQASLVQQARCNLRIGDMLLGLPTESRVFWTHHLRQPQTTEWHSDVARQAIQRLARTLDTGSPEGEVIKASMPDEPWGVLCTHRSATVTPAVPALADEVKVEPAKSTEPPAPEPAKVEPEGKESPEKTVPVKEAEQNVATKEAVPLSGEPTPKRSGFSFLLVGMILGLLIAVGAMQMTPQQVSGLLAAVSSEKMEQKPVSPPSPEKTAPSLPKAETVAAKPPVAEAALKPAPTPAQPKPEPQKPTPTTAQPEQASKPEPAPAPAPKKPVESKAETKTAPPVVVEKAKTLSPYERWQGVELAKLNDLFPNLRTWHDSVLQANWTEAVPYISGAHPSAFPGPGDYRAFLKWMAIDPPRDKEVRRSLFVAVIRACSPAECLEMFEPIVFYGGPQATDVQRAAGLMLDLFDERLTPEAKRRLKLVSEGKPEEPKSAKNSN